MNNATDKIYNEFDRATIDSFWGLLENLKWRPGESCKQLLIKQISPANSKKYTSILNRICDILVEEISLDISALNAFDVKLCVANIIGEKGYSGINALLENVSLITEQYDRVTTAVAQDSFLYMFPTADDYYPVY